MNIPPAQESRHYSTNPRPFFYAQPTAQQSFPNPWLYGPIYNPYGMPATGLRSGNPYLQCYSVPAHEYPRYLIPQPPMHMRIRRPYFGGPPLSPMVYQVPRFRHGFPMMHQPQNQMKQTEDKETQTDFAKSESGAKRHVEQDIGTKGCDAGNTENTAYIVSDTPKEPEILLEKTDKTISSAMSDRELAKNSSGGIPFQSLPPAGYAIEKEKVKIQYANDGAPAVQLWKSFKETIPLYEMAQKQVPKNIVQRDMLSHSPCEGVAYGSHEQGELLPCIPFSEEQKIPENMQKKQPLWKENQDSENKNYRAKGPRDEAGTVQLTEPIGPDHSGTKQDVLMAKIPPGFKKSSSSKAPQEVLNHIQQRKVFPSGMEMTNDAYLPQNESLNESNDMNNENWDTSESIQWCDDSEKYLPSESWLACMDNMDPNYNYEKYLFRRKRPNLLSITSDDMSSIEEGASTENSSVSIIVPDHLVRKDLCTFKKNGDGLGIGHIRSGGTLNEDEEVVEIEQATSEHSQNFKSDSRVKVKEIPSQIKKMSFLSRCSSEKHLYCLQKITGSSPSDADDSEEYWVMEPEEYEEQETEEYFVEEDMPYEIPNPDKSGLGQQIAQKVFWRIPKNAIPPHVINWPVQEKMSGLPTKLQKEQNEDLCDDYNMCLMRPMAQPLELLEHRRNPQKCSGWLQEDNRRTGPDEYWVKSGARPRSASLKPTATKEKDILEVFPFASDDLYMDCPKKKGVHKPPYKRRDIRCETAEVWEKPKITHHKEREAKKPPYKR